jgi:hypothetical protein
MVIFFQRKREMLGAKKRPQNVRLTSIKVCTGKE